MHVNITYPEVRRSTGARRKMLSILRWPFLTAALASVIVNLAVGDPKWSIIVVLSLYIAWKMVLSPDLVEYNRTSQSIKITLWSCVLLTLIDIFIADIWALFVVPLVCFGGILICAILFFTDLETQKHNMLPLILFAIAALFGSAITLYFHHGDGSWPLIVLGSFSLVLLVSLVIVLGQDFKRELARRFHFM